MADIKHMERMGYKQRPGDRDFICYSSFNFVPNYSKRIIKMAQAKILWLIADMIGIPITILGIIANIDNIKSSILAVLAITYLCIRVYFYIIEKNQKIRDKELDIRGKEVDIWFKEQNKLKKQGNSI